MKTICKHGQELGKCDVHHKARPGTKDTDAIRLIVRWWKDNMPRDWTIEECLQNPTVNFTRPSEKAMARAAAKFVGASE